MERRLEESVRAGDQEGYFRILAGSELVVPVPDDAVDGVLAGRSGPAWPTREEDGRVHVLAYTSAAAMRACLGPSWRHFMTLRFGDLAETWPDARWWLAVDAPGHPGGVPLPIEARMPAWFVRQVADGDGRPPQVGRPDLASAAAPAPAPAPASTPAPAAPPAPEPPAPVAEPAPEPAPETAPEPAAPPAPAQAAAPPAPSAPSPPAPSSPASDESPWEELQGQHRELPREAPREPARPEFHPANDVERELLRAAANNDHDLFLQTMADTEILLPVPDDTDYTLRPGRPGFPWRTREIDGSTVVPVFTSPERLIEAAHAAGTGTEYIKLPFTVALRYWPDHGWLLAINSGSPAGGTVMAAQLPGLATWADQRAAARMTDRFEPQNDIEQRLFDAARRRDTDTFFKVLLGAQVLVPADPDTPWGIAPDDPAFPWRPVTVHGRTSVQLFTSLKWMNEAIGSSRFVMPSLLDVVSAWPDPEWTLVLNPGTPIDATMPGEQVRALSGPPRTAPEKAATPPSAATPPPPENPAVPVAPAVPSTDASPVPDGAPNEPAGTGTGPQQRPGYVPSDPGAAAIPTGEAAQPSGGHAAPSAPAEPEQPAFPAADPAVPGPPGQAPAAPSVTTGGHPTAVPPLPAEQPAFGAPEPALGADSRHDTGPQPQVSAPNHEPSAPSATSGGFPTTGPTPPTEQLDLNAPDPAPAPGNDPHHTGPQPQVSAPNHEPTAPSATSGGYPTTGPTPPTEQPGFNAADPAPAPGNDPHHTGPQPQVSAPNHEPTAPSTTSGGYPTTGPTPPTEQPGLNAPGDGPHQTGPQPQVSAADHEPTAPSTTSGGHPTVVPPQPQVGLPGGGEPAAPPVPPGGREDAPAYGPQPPTAEPSYGAYNNTALTGDTGPRHLPTTEAPAEPEPSVPDAAGGYAPEANASTVTGGHAIVGLGPASDSPAPEPTAATEPPGDPQAPERRLRPVGAPEPEFEPGNRIDQELYEAALGGDSDAFLRVLLNANVLVPIPADAPLEVTPVQREFRWDAALRDGTAVRVFTSLVRLREVLPESRFVYADFRELIGAWPRDDWALLLNPGTRIGASLRGDQVRALSEWALRVGLVQARPAAPAAPPAPREPAADMTVQDVVTAAPARTEDLDDRVSQPTIMQKVVPHGHVGWYLEQGYDRVGGFVHPTGDVAELQTPVQLYEALGLLYEDTPFSPADEGVYVIRWPAYCPDLYRIPFGGRDAEEMASWGDAGWVIERPPFVGGGFAPGSAGSIREYKVDSVRLPYGAEMYYLGMDRSERFVAMYDPDRLAWLRPDASTGSDGRDGRAGAAQ
ncbi:SseB family protein [Actinomadura nitritigenes]|uniref:SseB family protein n=1 Tax=Actinomadura nitritigenes TaxID=134602 RepID=UPI003684AC3F